MNSTKYANGIIDFRDIVRANGYSNQHHFFDAGATRFFNSRYPQTGIVKDNKAYFVTSEQFDYKSPRLYTVRVCNMETGIVDTIGEFQQYQTSKQAQAAIKKIVKPNIRVTQKMSFDNPPKPYYIIEEIVTPQGHYIDWQGIYESELKAIEAIANS